MEKRWGGTSDERDLEHKEGQTQSNEEKEGKMQRKKQSKEKTRENRKGRRRSATACMRHRKVTEGKRVSGVKGAEDRTQREREV